MVQRAIEELANQIHDTHADTGFRFAFRALLTKGDGAGHLIANTAERTIWVRRSDDHSLHQVYLPPNNLIPYQDGDTTLETMEVRIGYPPGVKGLGNLQVLDAATSAGKQAIGTASPWENYVAKSFYTEAENIWTLRARPTNPVSLDIAVDGEYLYRNTLGQWVAYATTNVGSALTTAVAALTGGQHQLGIIYLDRATGNLGLALNTAASASGALPSRAEWTITNALALANTLPTTYTLIDVIYLYYAQPFWAEADFYRTWPIRDVWGPNPIASDILLASLGTSTYKTVQDAQTLQMSAGLLTGGTITDNGNGTVTVATGSGLVRSSNSALATLYFCTWAANAALALTNNAANWVYVTYNSGTPIVAASTSAPDYESAFPLGLIYRNGTELHMFWPARTIMGDFPGLLNRMLQQVFRFMPVTRPVVTDLGTQHISVSAGSWWQGLNSFTTNALDTSAAGRFNNYYRNGSGGWTEVTGQAQWDNTHYDNGTGTLATLTAAHYGVYWLFVASDNDYHVQFGQGDYTLNQAQATTQPTAPPEVQVDSVCIARLIFKKSDTTLTQIDPMVLGVIVPSAGGGGGGVASVTASSPLASSGGATPDISVANQSANLVLAGPTSGGAAAPTFRSLVALDIPNLDASIITSGVLASARGGAGITVNNNSGATANANDVGYIGADGQYVTTTTANLNGVAWCVVLVGGAASTDIIVARRGRVTIVLDGNCSVGDFLTTSSTAKQAHPNTLCRPEVFARALTANSGGAGGTCTAILLTGSTTVSAKSGTNLFRVINSSATGWLGTINGAPSATSVVVTTTGGALSTVTPYGTHLLYARLYNLTRGDYRLVESISGSTITTVSKTDSWANGDSLTFTSQVITGVPGGVIFLDLDFINQTTIPVTARALLLTMNTTDTGGKSITEIHPGMAWSDPAADTCQGQATNTFFFFGPRIMPIISGLFGTTLYSSSGTSTAQNGLQLDGWIEATP